MQAFEVVDLLGHVVRREAVTGRPGPVGTRSGFGSRSPVDLDALELQQRLAWAAGAEYVELEAMALERIERPARVPLGLCACGTPVSCEFDRVAAQCGGCGAWLSRAESVDAAREYVDSTWLTPGEVEAETRGWGEPVSAARVRQWRCRGRIVPDEHGRYRLADVLALIDVTACL